MTPAPAGRASVDGLVVGVQRAVQALAEGAVSGRPVDVAAVLVLAERLRGLGLRGLGELDATGQHVGAGAPTAAAWLRRTVGIAEDSARGAVRLAARLRTELPQVAGLLERGGTTLEHVRACAAGTAGLDPELVGGAQPALCALVQAAEPAVVRRQLRERAEAIDPALGRDAARRQQARQGFFADPVRGAGVLLGGSLCDEDGAVLLHGLDLCVEADRTAGDTRGLPARRADALVQWARQAAAQTAGPGDTLAGDAHTVRSSLLITCTPDQLTALTQPDPTQPATEAATQEHDQDRDGDRDQDLDLADDRNRDRATALARALALLTGSQPAAPPALPTGAPLLPEQLRRLACDTTLTLILTTDTATASPAQPGTGGRLQPLHVGRAARTVTGTQFKALVVRDRHCVARGCSRRPAQCAAHHVQHWLDGGPTDLPNLILLCHRHHHDHHDRGHDLQHHDGRWITTHGWDHDPP